MSAKRHCSTHPDAPHGFDRNSSHSLGRYVCTCETWTPPEDHYRKGYRDGLEAAAKACLEIANNSKMDDEKFGHENDATYYGRYEGATDCIDAIRAMIEKED